MGEVIKRKQGDTGPDIVATLKNGDGTVANLTGATVKFNLRGPTGTLVVDHATATVLDAANGRVKYAIQSGNLAALGAHRMEWEVAFGGGGPTITYPNDGDDRLIVVPQVA